VARLVVLLVLSGCAAAVCDDCPTVTLSANGATAVTAAVGTAMTYTWSSTHADTASSTVTVSPTTPDACGIHDGPWVVSTLAGTSDPVPLASCQSGYAYRLELVVTQAATGDTASADVIVTVP
jgi:hypothetical protein